MQAMIRKQLRAMLAVTKTPASRGAPPGKSPLPRRAFRCPSSRITCVRVYAFPSLAGKGVLSYVFMTAFSYASARFRVALLTR